MGTVVVRMPDGALVRMPENPTDDDMRAALTTSISNLQEKANAERAAKHGKKTWLFDATSPELEKARELAKSFDAQVLDKQAETGGAWEKLRRDLSLGGGAIARGLAALPAMAADAGLALTGHPEKATASEDVAKLGLKPKTFGEKLSVAAIEGATGGVVGTGPKVAGAAIGAGSGVGSEVAANALGDNLLTRLLGGTLGGGISAAGMSHLPTNAEKLLQQSVAQVPPSAWRRAAKMEGTLNSAEIPHLKSQLLGPTSTLDDLMAVAATHPAIRPSVISAMENVPTKARSAVEKWTMSNLPIGMDETRQVLGDTQEAAAARIAALKDMANAEYVSNMPPLGLPISKSTVKSGRNQLESLASAPEKYGRLSGAAREYLLGVSGTLKEAFKQAQKDKTPLTVDEVATMVKFLNLKAAKEGLGGEPVRDVKGILRGMTPEYDAARQAKTDFMRQQVNPVERGLTGQLAQMGGGVKPDRYTARTSALNIVFPTDVKQPLAIKELAQQIGPERVGDLAREHISREIYRAISGTADAPWKMPATLQASLTGAGSMKQSLGTAKTENLTAAIEAASAMQGVPPAGVRNGFYKLLTALSSYRDLNLPHEVDRAVLQQRAGLNIPGLLVAPNSRLGRALWERTTEKTFKDIADVVMSPDGLRKLQALQHADVDSPEMRAFIASLGATAAQSGRNTEQ